MATSNNISSRYFEVHPSYSHKSSCQGRRVTFSVVLDRYHWQWHNRGRLLLPAINNRHIGRPRLRHSIIPHPSRSHNSRSGLVLHSRQNTQDIHQVPIPQIPHPRASAERAPPAKPGTPLHTLPNQKRANNRPKSFPKSQNELRLHGHAFLPRRFARQLRS